MQKLDGKTFNVVQDNIEKLKQLFPEVFTENKIDFEKLMLTLGEHVEKEKERYEFTWNGKTKAIQLAQKQTTGTLRPCKEESVNWDTTKNLYIEGDNLEVLRVLQNSYRNKVKMIYIDPPYNTGNDFVYKDDFHDNIKNYKEKTEESMKSNPETNGRYHTDWLNMMYPRLKLAKNLLTQNGVIFISIDDNEVHNLRKICDEIFGEHNFVGQIIVQTNKGGQDYLDLAKTHEYLLCYFKSNEAALNLLPKADTSSFKYEDNKGKFEIRELRNRNPKFNKNNRPNLYYPIYVNPEIKDKNGFSPVSLVKENDKYIEIFPLNSQGKESCWRWGKNLLAENIIENDPENSNVIAKEKRNGGWNIYEKNRKTLTKAKTIWDEADVRTERGTIVFRELFGSSYFDHPKPVELIKKSLMLGLCEHDTVLDFFAGSSTTAHAVFDLNSEDNGKRKFILIQLDEPITDQKEAFKVGFKNICEIGKERIRRAGQKILEENKDKEGIENLDIGFKVFKLDDTNLKVWDEQSVDVERNLLDLIDPIKEGRTQEDVVYEILLKYGVDLTVPIEETKVADKVVYSVGMGYLLICLERDLTLEHIEEIAKKEPARVVFYDEGFKDDTVRINAQQILKRYGVEDIRVI